MKLPLLWKNCPLAPSAKMNVSDHFLLYLSIFFLSFFLLFRWHQASEAALLPACPYLTVSMGGKLSNLFLDGSRLDRWALPLLRLALLAPFLPGRTNYRASAGGRASPSGPGNHGRAAKESLLSQNWQKSEVSLTEPASSHRWRRYFSEILTEIRVCL